MAYSERTYVGTGPELIQCHSIATLSLAYNEHFDAKKSAHYSRVLIVTKLVVAGIFTHCIVFLSGHYLITSDVN